MQKAATTGTKKTGTTGRKRGAPPVPPKKRSTGVEAPPPRGFPAAKRERKVRGSVAEVVELGAKGAYPEQAELEPEGACTFGRDDPEAPAPGIEDVGGGRAPWVPAKLDPDFDDRPRVTIPNAPITTGDIGRFGTCAADEHAPTCPRRVNHLVTRDQVVGPNRFLSPECKGYRILQAAEDAKRKILAAAEEQDNPEQLELGD